MEDLRGPGRGGAAPAGAVSPGASAPRTLAGSSVPGASSLCTGSAAAPEQLLSIPTKARKSGRGLR